MEMSNIALKEWAVTIKALDEGRQVLLLRKGGIREKRFNVEHERFFLYPAYEHQLPSLIKEPLLPDLDQVLASWDGRADQVTFTHWAQITDSIEVTEPEEVARLSSHYIWTTNYAQKRLHWRPKQPLAILLVRTYRLPEPRTIEVLPYYNGCKSWVDMAVELPMPKTLPVLGDEEYQRKAETIKEALKEAIRA